MMATATRGKFMVHYGTVVNGVIVPDGPTLPEGTRVRLEPADIEDFDDVTFPPTDTYEEHIESLRQSIAEIKAGVPGILLDEAMARISAELNLPPIQIKD
jgi:hypothetical protein